MTIASPGSASFPDWDRSARGAGVQLRVENEDGDHDVRLPLDEELGSRLDLGDVNA